MIQVGELESFTTYGRSCQLMELMEGNWRFGFTSLPVVLFSIFLHRIPFFLVLASRKAGPCRPPTDPKPNQRITQSPCGGGAVQLIRLFLNNYSFVASDFRPSSPMVSAWARQFDGGGDKTGGGQVTWRIRWGLCRGHEARLNGRYVPHAVFDRFSGVFCYSF